MTQLTKAPKPLMINDSNLTRRWENIGKHCNAIDTQEQPTHKHSSFYFIGMQTALPHENDARDQEMKEKAAYRRK